MKNVKRILTLLLISGLTLSIGTYALATDAPNITENTPAITEKFVAESDYSVVPDTNGDKVIILTHLQELPTANLSVANRSVLDTTKNYAQTTVAILPSDENQAEEIIANIQTLIAQGSGSYSTDGWFYASSVYLSSTIYYNTSTIGGILAGGITSVTISCTVNSGSSLSSMSLLMGQLGFAPDGSYKSTQSTTFDAKTVRTFYAPSSWSVVRWDDSSSVGAHITCTATRQGGQSTFYLYNVLKGA